MKRTSTILACALLLCLQAGCVLAADGACDAGAAESGGCKLPAASSPRPAAGAPGLLLLQGKYMASIDVEGKRRASLWYDCAPFSEWPHLDHVTCWNCQALVTTVPYNRCDQYCSSFGHVCAAAAEEVAESCRVKRYYDCDEVIPRTSDMLCTCRRPYPGETVPVRTTPAPSAPTAPVCGAGRSCEHCNKDEPPRHAGCIVVKDGKLLTVRIAYGSKKFDIPGGQSNWQEPASCTAHRETYEDTGYEVSPTELLAGGLQGGGFNVYRCRLLKDAPTANPDPEAASVHWLTKEEVQERLDQNLWRFPEARHYVEWMR